jgi:transaldolase
MIEEYKYPCKILAASFKTMDQVNEAFEAGAETATMSVDLLVDALNQDEIHKAVEVFEQDWESIYGIGMKLKDIE